MQFSIAKPEEVGVSSAALSQTLDYLAQRRVALHSLLVMRHDALICEGYAAPFTKDTLHRMYSETKSLVSLTVGVMCAKGYLDLDDHIVDYFAEKLPLGGPSPELARLTIRDMLRMATPYNGTTYKRWPTKDWVGSFFTARADHEPGSFFCYDTSSSHTLCALVEKRMGRPLLDVLRREALDAIGFSEQSYCIRDPMGISQGGSGLMATPRDMLALLRLVAQGGQWDGQQLLPQNYLQAATAWQIDNAENGGSGGWDFAQGYGYQFWRLTHNAWSMYGMGGQLAICLPDQDMLLVTTADTQPLAGGVQTILDAFWNCLLPGVADATLPANPAAYAEQVIHHAVADCGKPGGPRHRALLCDGADGPQRSRPDGPAAARKRAGAELRRQDLHAAFPGGGIGAKPSVGRPRATLRYRRRLACSGLPPSPGASAGRATGQPEFAAKAAPRRCDPGSVQP